MSILDLEQLRSQIDSNWFLLFGTYFLRPKNEVNIFLESVEKHLEQISFKSASADSLAAALKTVLSAADVENITLDKLVDNHKYIQAASLLGSKKFLPRFAGNVPPLTSYFYDNNYSKIIL